jgi:hypothetical protein
MPHQRTKFLLKLASIEIASIVIGGGIGFLDGAISSFPDSPDSLASATFLGSNYGCIFGGVDGILISGLLYDREASLADTCGLVSVSLLGGLLLGCILALASMSRAVIGLSMFVTPVVAVVGAFYLRLNRPQLIN